ncbi:RNase H domain-containing protein [Durusdinium trenchii]|uniref:RNase H domain-containing protein n=4 Tax=Durusdinium trenchii TaxID=1381693 RepID=A0ABP0JQX1_9DINO
MALVNDNRAAQIPVGIAVLSKDQWDAWLATPSGTALWKVREDANALKVSLSSATKHKAKCLRKTDLLTGGFWLCDVTLPDDTFREWLKKGTLVRDQEESFTCYMDFFKMMKEPFCQMTPAMWQLEERPWIHACGTSPPAPQWTFYVPLDKKTCDMMLPEHAGRRGGNWPDEAVPMFEKKKEAVILMACMSYDSNRMVTVSVNAATASKFIRPMPGMMDVWYAPEDALREAAGSLQWSVSFVDLSTKASPHSRDNCKMAFFHEKKRKSDASAVIDRTDGLLINEDIERTDNICKRLKTIKEELAAGTLSRAGFDAPADDPNDLPRCIAPCLAETLANGYGERADVLGYLPGFWASPETPPTTTTTGMPCDTVGAQSCLQTVVAITDIQEFCARLPTAVECLKVAGCCQQAQGTIVGSIDSCATGGYTVEDPCTNDMEAQCRVTCAPGLVGAEANNASCTSLKRTPFCMRSQSCCPYWSTLGLDTLASNCTALGYDISDACGASNSFLVANEGAEVRVTCQSPRYANGSSHEDYLCQNSSFELTPPSQSKLQCVDPPCALARNANGTYQCFLDGQLLSLADAAVMQVPLGTSCTLQCSKSFEVPTPPMELHCAYVESDFSDIIYRDPLMVTSTGVPRMVERLADGSLRPAVPQVCEIMTCPLPSVQGLPAVVAGNMPQANASGEILYIECDGLSQFARCSPVCAYGYEVDSLRYLLCDTGTFQGEVRCVKQRCAGSAPWPFGTSGSLSSCTDGLHGQFCEVLCAAGYTRDSNLASYQCEAGQWMVPTTPPCIESSCFAAPVLENAQRLQACANRPAGYECNVTCLSGYQPVGSLRCVRGAYELSGLGCVASAVATRTAQVAAAQVVLVSVSEAEANTTRGRVERSARGLLGLDSTVTPAQLAALVAEEVPSISPLDRALALAALQQLSPEAALRAALRTLLTAAIIPEVEAIFPVVEVALTRLDAHGVWANASEVLVQSSPSNLDQWLTATLQRLLGASLSATALQALAQDLPDAVDRTSLELQRVFSASLARSMTTAAALNATALVQYEMGESLPQTEMDALHLALVSRFGQLLESSAGTSVPSDFDAQWAAAIQRFNLQDHASSVAALGALASRVTSLGGSMELVAALAMQGFWQLRTVCADTLLRCQRQEERRWIEAGRASAQLAKWRPGGFLNAAEIAAAVPRVSGGGAYLLAGALSTFGVEEQDCQVEDAVLSQVTSIEALQRLPTYTAVGFNLGVLLGYDLGVMTPLEGSPAPNVLGRRELAMEWAGDQVAGATFRARLAGASNAELTTAYLSAAQISASKKILWLCSPELLDPSTLGPPVAASPSGIALRGLFVVNSSVGREHYLESPLAWHGLGGGLTRLDPSLGPGASVDLTLETCSPEDFGGESIAQVPQRLEALSRYDFIVLGGGKRTSMTEHEGWKEILKRLKVPLLGICLGSQQLTRAHGMKLSKLDRKYVCTRPFMNLASNGELCFSHEFGTYVRQFKGRKHFKVIWSHKLMNSEGKEVDISMLYEYQDPSGKYMLGCQGHPEKPATEPSVRQELFGRFFRAVERVRTRGGSVRGSEELEQVEAVEGSNLLDGCDVENGLKLEEECGIGCDGSLNLEEDEGSSVDQGDPYLFERHAPSNAFNLLEGNTNAFKLLEGNPPEVDEAQKWMMRWYSPQCVGINDLHEKVLRGCPSFEMCCFFDGHHGARCWDAQAGYTYERCCSLGSENNERHIPLWHSRWILLELRNGGYLNISQEPTSNEWAAYRDENIPGLLWKSAYAMFRWLEALAAPPFQIFRGRRVLELGAGIGLLSIMAALGGAAEVVSTDASWSSVGLIERNAQYTHTRGVRGAVAARQLDWANVTNMQSERLARRRLQDLQIGPGPFDVVICSALGYVKLTTFKALLCILDLVTDQQSLLLWGGGGSSTNDLNVSAAWPTRGGRKDEKLQLLLEAFRIAGRFLAEEWRPVSPGRGRRAEGFQVL